MKFNIFNEFASKYSEFIFTKRRWKSRKNQIELIIVICYIYKIFFLYIYTILKYNKKCTHHNYTILVRRFDSGSVQYFPFVYIHLPTGTLFVSLAYINSYINYIQTYIYPTFHCNNNICLSNKSNQINYMLILRDVSQMIFTICY